MKDGLVIIMSRDNDSGGHYVCEKLGQDLNIPFYDSEMIIELAKKGSIADAEKMTVPPAHHSYKGGYEWMPTQEEFNAQTSIIKQLAEKGNCIMCGRCADYILRDRPDTFRFFIRTDFDRRIKDFVKAYHLDSEEGAREKLQKLDNGRAGYYKYYTGQEWGKMENFNLMIDTTICSKEKAVDVVETYLRSCNYI